MSRLGRIALSPLTWYLLGLVAFTIQDGILSQQQLGVGKMAGLLRANVLAYLLMTWTCLDSFRRREPFPCDMVVLNFQIFFPIYLIHSRGWRGLGLLALIALIPLGLRGLLPTALR
jgi:hypothetical protein